MRNRPALAGVQMDDGHGPRSWFWHFAAYASVFSAAAGFFKLAGWPVIGENVEWWRLWLFAAACMLALGGASYLTRDELVRPILRWIARRHRERGLWVPKPLLETRRTAPLSVEALRSAAAGSQASVELDTSPGHAICSGS